MPVQAQDGGAEGLLDVLAHPPVVLLLKVADGHHAGPTAHGKLHLCDIRLRSMVAWIKVKGHMDQGQMSHGLRSKVMWIKVAWIKVKGHASRDQMSYGRGSEVKLGERTMVTWAVMTTHHLGTT